MSVIYKRLNVLSRYIFPGTFLNPRVLYGAVKAIWKRGGRDFLGIKYGSDVSTVNIWVDDCRLLICGIPKVATTTFTHKLVYHRVLGSNVGMKTGKLSELLRENPRLADYYKVAFVRNPWARVVSAYNSKVCAKKPMFVASIFIRYRGIRHKMPFEEFIEWLCNSEEGSDSCADRHWISQALLIRHEGTVLVDKVARVEHLQEDWEEICRELKVDPPRLENLSLRTSSETDSYRRYYSERTQALVRKRYADDVRFFDYEF